MSESKHTPGPWKVDKTWGLIIGPHNEEIGAIHAAIGVETRRGNLRKVIQETAGANACLMAAAPLMLEGLKLAAPLLRKAYKMTAAKHLEEIIHGAETGEWQEGK